MRGARRSARTVSDQGFRRSELGFTLLEVLVALSILGIAVTIVFQLFSSNLRNLTASEDYVKACVKADALMREVLENEKLDVSSWTQATPDGYRLDVSVADTLSDRTKELPVKLLEVVLTLHWQKDAKERSLTLRTMKMVQRRI
ncbi:MAG TPA: prepilin-type N-terminal cleavage/methylation domain-containing protein [Syntrophorhabdaceae bacterium]|nr:prepilin-type N-terminal cleavage/methylation domain-containing protein [Syntrophorhabdaceae bacterium]